MGVASGIGHFFESIVEMIQGIFATIFHIFEGAISAVLSFFQLALDTVFGLFKGLAHTVENTLGFAVRKSPPAFFPVVSLSTPESVPSMRTLLLTWLT